MAARNVEVALSSEEASFLKELIAAVRTSSSVSMAASRREPMACAWIMVGEGLWDKKNVIDVHVVAPIPFVCKEEEENWG